MGSYFHSVATELQAWCRDVQGANFTEYTSRSKSFNSLNGILDDGMNVKAHPFMHIMTLGRYRYINTALFESVDTREVRRLLDPVISCMLYELEMYLMPHHINERL